MLCPKSSESVSKPQRHARCFSRHRLMMKTYAASSLQLSRRSVIVRCVHACALCMRAKCVFQVCVCVCHASTCACACACGWVYMYDLHMRICLHLLGSANPRTQTFSNRARSMYSSIS